MFINHFDCACQFMSGNVGVNGDFIEGFFYKSTKTV